MLVRLIDVDGEADPIGEQLRELIRRQMEPVMSAVRRGERLGIGRASCNAAVVLDLADGGRAGSYGAYDRVTLGGHDCSVLYGNSRLFTGLDQVAQSGATAARSKITAHTPSKSGAYEEHAEQVAILTAEQRGLPFWRDNQAQCHVFGTLDPCKDCAPWLQRRPERWVYHSGAITL